MTYTRCDNRVVQDPVLVMISPAFRATCAAVGVLLLASAAFLILDQGLQRIELIPIVFGVLFLVPSAFGGGRSRLEATGLLEDARRFRLAALLCFAFALGMFISAMAAGGETAIGQAASSLAAACSVVAMLLMFLFAFTSSRLRSIAGAERRNQ